MENEKKKCQISENVYVNKMKIEELIEKVKSNKCECCSPFELVGNTVYLKGYEYPNWVWEIQNLFKVDYNYAENMKKKIIRKRNYEAMSEDELNTVITYIYRGENFNGGIINTNLKDGTILRLLERKLELVSNAGEDDLNH